MSSPRLPRGRADVEVEVDGRQLMLSSLDRVMWPRVRFTKGAMLDYYMRAAPALLRHVARRPVTLARFPEGIDARGWYQTQCRGRPEWMTTRVVPGRGGPAQEYCVVNDVSSLLWVVNRGAVELHPLLAREDALDAPTMVVFDLDPGPPANLIDACRIALVIREALDAHGLRSFAKTSGSVGVHVFVPLNSPHTYAQTKSFARALAADLARATPDEVVDRQARSARSGKVLVDWLQNDARRSTVAAYSLRATDRPTVSVPVAWAEIEDAVRRRDPDLLTFTPSEVLERLEDGDPFALVQGLRQDLPRGRGGVGDAPLGGI